MIHNPMNNEPDEDCQIQFRQAVQFRKPDKTESMGLQLALIPYSDWTKLNKGGNLNNITDIMED